MQKVTERVFVESEISQCNSSIFNTGEGVVVIDTPMIPAYAKQWAKQASEFGEIKYVINTEPHGDHTTGNCYFGGTLIAHEGVRDAVLASSIDSIKGMVKMNDPAAELDKDFKFRPPDITYSKRLTFYLGKYSFHLMNMPGHTPFQSIVYVPEERIVFTSDNISRVMPFFHQALPDTWLVTLKDMEKLDVDYVVPGHGPVGGKECFKEMFDKVTLWTETVKRAIENGLTVEEAQKTLTMAKEFPGLPNDERTRGIVAMNVGAIYKYYKKE